MLSLPKSRRNCGLTLRNTTGEDGGATWRTFAGTSLLKPVKCLLSGVAMTGDECCTTTVATRRTSVVETKG
jgi:hypothetical protein